MGTWFSDKYAEGTIGHRFYAGCQNVDTVESLAAEHARELFGAPYAYVAAALRHRRQPGRVLVDPRPPRRDARRWRSSAPRTSTSSPRPTGRRCARELGNQRLLGMSLDAGGHLTHGFRPNISGKMFHQQQYGTDPETGLLDYDAVRAKAREFKPLVLVAGYSAYPRRVNFAKMREIADEVGATLMVDMAHFAGPGRRQGVHRRRGPGAARPHRHHDHPQVAARPARRHGAGARRSTPPSVDRGCPMVLGGPLSHVMAAKAVALAEARQPAFQTYAQNDRRQRQVAGRGLPDARRHAWSPAAPTTTSCCSTSSSFGLTGRQAESALLDAGVVTNRNSVPADPNGAWYTSGIRLGTPALTTRGFGHDEFDKVAELMVDVLQQHPARHHQGRRARRRRRTRWPTGSPTASRPPRAEMLDKNPLYPGLEAPRVTRRGAPGSQRM